jgi:hypothetical protein
MLDVKQGVAVSQRCLRRHAIASCFMDGESVGGRGQVGPPTPRRWSRAVAAELKPPVAYYTRAGGIPEQFHAHLARSFYNVSKTSCQITRSDSLKRR